MFDFYVTLNIDESKINQLITGQEHIMGILDTVTEALDQAKADAIAERAEVQEKLNGLSTQVTDLTNEVQSLKDQIANGQTVSQEDIDAVLAKVNDLDTSIKDVSEALPEATEPTNPENPV